MITITRQILTFTLFLEFPSFLGKIRSKNVPRKLSKTDIILEIKLAIKNITKKNKHDRMMENSRSMKNLNLT